MNRYDAVKVNKVSRWQMFFRNIQQDLKLYLFVLMVFCIFRIGFIGVLNQYINEASTWKDIVVALYYGIRISLKSSGIITLFSFLFSTLLNVIFVGKNLDKVRFYLGCMYILILSVLFNARIPFYEEFHIAFNQFIFNTFNDDVVALAHTMVQQYHLVERLLLAFLFTLILCWGLKQILGTRTFPLPQFSRWYTTLFLRVSIIVGIFIFMLFSRFGGGLNYATSVQWENATMTKDDFLNEAILDDIQALNRARMSYQRLKDAKGLNIEAGRMGEYAAHLAGRTIDSRNIDDFLRKKGQGPQIAKPRHIFIIVGESYDAWPLMPKYKDLNIANGLKSIIAQENAASIPAFLPNATGSMDAMNALITGLAEVNLSPNYQSKAYQEKYSTAMAPQMKKLGYKTYLWYGGFAAWQRIQEFSLVQGFDEFHASNDMLNQSGNAWGSEDKKFLQGISAMFTDDQPSIHVIFTTSNHPPFTVDVAQEGFDPSLVLDGVPERSKSKKEVMDRLGHFWYADKYITEFIQTMYQQYPDSVFVVTGDHGNRFHIETSPNLYEGYAVPFVIYGNGIRRDLFPQSTAGSHISIVPTLIELIAPKGFEYYSIAQSMTNPNLVGVSRENWITSDRMSKVHSGIGESNLWPNTTKSEVDNEKIKQDVDAMQAISWWIIQHGKNID